MERTLAALAASLLSASLACAAARAQTGAPAGAPAERRPPVYRVELVVFRATSALGSPENWAAEAGTAPGTSTDADPDASAATAGPDAAQPGGSAPGGAQTGGSPASGAASSEVLQRLPPSAFELDGVASRLRASGRYVPVAHVAWTQNASPWSKPVEIPVQSVGLDVEGITGTVALERGVYLHLALDLRYAMSDPPAGLDAPPGTVFVLDQSHRVRLKERNYFDHPAFGVIALVTNTRAASRAGR